MQISTIAQRQLRKIPHEKALELLQHVRHYEQNHKGYIKWLEGRPGYRLRTPDYRVIFEPAETGVTILNIIVNKKAAETWT